MSEERLEDAPQSASKGLTNLEKLESLAKSISLVAIPIVVAIMGNQLNQTISAQQANTKYVELALQILARKPPMPPTASEQDISSDRNLRSWAVDLLGATSPVKMSKVTQAGLIDGSATLSEGPRYRYSARIIYSMLVPPSQIGICKGSSLPIMPRADIYVVPGTNTKTPLPAVEHFNGAIQVHCGNTESNYNTIQLGTAAKRLLQHSPSGIVTVIYNP